MLTTSTTRSRNPSEQPPAKRRQRAAYALVACTACKARIQRLESTLAKIQQSVNSLIDLTAHTTAEQNDRQSQRLPCSKDAPSGFVLSETSVHRQSLYACEASDLNNGRDLPMHPISFVHSFEVAKSKLQTKGYPMSIGSDVSSIPGPSTTAGSPPVSSSLPRHSVQSLIELGHDETLRLLSLFQDALAPFYPCFDIDAAKELSRIIFDRFSRPSSIAGPARSSEECPLHPKRVEILKGLLSLSLLFDACDGSGVSFDMNRHDVPIEWSIDACAIYGTPELDDVLMAILLVSAPSWFIRNGILLSLASTDGLSNHSIDFLHRDEPLKASRVLSFAFRAALELGMHKISGPTAVDLSSEELESRKLIVCTIYSLDRATGLATGLPFSVDDTYVDENCFHLKGCAANTRGQRETQAFLRCSIAYDRLLLDIYSLNNEGPLSKQVNQDRIDLLGMKIDRILNQIPEHLQYHQPQNLGQSPRARSIASQQAVLRIRGHHLKILLKTRDLFPIKGSAQQEDSARVLLESDRHLECLFDYFTMSALAALVLTVSQNPPCFSQFAGPAFHKAIAILRSSPRRVYRPQRLWCSFDELEKIAASLGIPPSEGAPMPFNMPTIDTTGQSPFTQGGILQMPIGPYGSNGG
ncbi:C6 transcription factor [Fusarium tjaetaba]|uniref:C6 transcription factor n=1 Tax=Fusarium tjaetaba TaxID=1567544 RepID=A0A8H5QE94_9HYPO|nr:C6 transcription factor [Fusarium tjaetaba]KAF5613644.1 C6 transcription factor [Fusarium tjaetaba]